jgi:ATP/maltotriose-dependent transcriptional regulator MalT
MAGDREWNKGWAIHRLGDFEEGLHLVREGVRQWNETGAALHATNYEICLVEIYILQGQTAVARSHLAAAQAHSRRYGENYLTAEVNRLEALVLQCEGAPTAMVHERLANAQAIARQAEARMNSSRRSRRCRSRVRAAESHRRTHPAMLRHEFCRRDVVTINCTEGPSAPHNLLLQITKKSFSQSLC